MNHLGNICNISGAEVEPVDVIIGGSPCQDLSVAGKRAGLAGERSGLYMEQIRIVREMRDATACKTDGHVQPRFMVWENVPGAFSSKGKGNALEKGDAFRIVLEEAARVADSNAVIPRPPGGIWATAGAVMGDGWSIAWRVLDAQFWGVPQRRRRIALVADFGGQSAPEILFEREGVRGDIAESGTEGQGAAGDAEKGVGTTVGLTNRGYCVGNIAETLRAQSHGAIPMVNHESGVGETECYPINTQIITRHNALGRGTGFGLGKNGDPAFTIQAGHEHGVAVLFEPKSALEENWAESNVKNALRAGESKSSHAVYDARGNDDSSIAPTMTGNHQNRVPDYTGIVTYQKTTGPLMANSHPGSYSGQDAYTDMFVAAVDCRNGTETPDINGTLQAKPNGGMSCNLQNTVRTYQSVRRLTPLECERLQGFPDNWTNIPPQTDVTEEDLTFWRTVWDEWDDMNGKKRHSDKQIIKWLKSEAADSARYKALGNSIALPPWRFVLSRIHNQGARTMASLFDGIGGFPKIWQELGGQTLWCSEVEPFPIAVTMYHFKEVRQ